MELLIARVIVCVSCALLTVVPLYFILHNVYKDGAIGRVALFFIALFASSIEVEWLIGPLVGVPSDAETLRRLLVGLIACFTVFLCWHLVRFHRRVLNPRSDPLPEPEQTARKQTPALLKVHG
jgi:hypothetical protein